MKIIASAGKKEIAMVYVAETDAGGLVECVEAVQPPIPREEKWVLMVSTMYGCPVGCQMCDAGGYYEGKVSAEDILAQIDLLVDEYYSERVIPCKQFKLQFARMGEPSLNMGVLDALEALLERYDAPGLMPSLSTIAPRGREVFFERLLEIKDRLYPGGNFQFQFSVHTTNETDRDELLPVRKWSFAEMAAYGQRFRRPGDRKVTLNFALANESTVDVNILQQYFSPETFLIKITPLNPTYRARESNLTSYIDPFRGTDNYHLVEKLRDAGYQVIVSIGEVEENYIGSNCGQYVRRHLEAVSKIDDGYTYPVNQ